MNFDFEQAKEDYKIILDMPWKQHDIDFKGHEVKGIICDLNNLEVSPKQLIINQEQQELLVKFTETLGYRVFIGHGNKLLKIHEDAKYKYLIQDITSANESCITTINALKEGRINKEDAANALSVHACLLNADMKAGIPPEDYRGWRLWFGKYSTEFKIYKFPETAGYDVEGARYISDLVGDKLQQVDANMRSMFETEVNMEAQTQKSHIELSISGDLTGVKSVLGSLQDDIINITRIAETEPERLLEQYHKALEYHNL